MIKFLLLAMMPLSGFAQITTATAPTILSSSGTVTSGHCLQFGGSSGTVTDTGTGSTPYSPHFRLMTITP